MSTILDAGVVDHIALHRPTGTVQIIACDHLPWDEEEEHLDLLDAKLSSYLDFVTSDQLAKTLLELFGEVSPRLVEVEVVAMYPLSAAGAAFISHARAAFREAGFGLRHEVRERA